MCGTYASGVMRMSEPAPVLQTKKSPNRGASIFKNKHGARVSSSPISGKPIEITLRVIGAANRSSQLFVRGTGVNSSPILRFSRCIGNTGQLHDCQVEQSKTKETYATAHAWENVEFGNLIPGKYCCWREIFSILRGNLSLGWKFQSFSYQNFMKFVNKSTFWCNCWPHSCAFFSALI